jgi:hypothetical protein
MIPRHQPLPLPVVSQLWRQASLDASPRASAAATCLVFGFFFLLRPDEYLGSPRLTQFSLGDAHILIGNRALDNATCPTADIMATTFVTPSTFNRKKNGSVMKQ